MSSVPVGVIKQAEWQKGRQKLSWPEKIRMAEAVRESVIALRKTRPSSPASAVAASPEPTK